MELSLLVKLPLYKVERVPEFLFDAPIVDPIEFSKELVKVMLDNKGVTLTPPQVGVNIRAIAFAGHPENFCCYNPRIVQFGDKISSMEESSLSYPGLVVKVKRPASIRVRFQMPNSETQTQVLSGLSARAFQHSLDFLDGVSFISRANPIHREKALKNYKQYMKELNNG